MKLHILRHAKTNQESKTGRDYDRDLLPKGEKQCKILKHHFEEHLGPIKMIFCSSAVRTRSTLKLVDKHIKFKDVTFLDELYLADFKKILSILNAHSINEDVLLVGHNYGISDLTHYLTDFDIELRTGEYVCIDFKDLNLNEISKSTGTICDRFRPMP